MTIEFTGAWRDEMLPMIREAFSEFRQAIRMSHGSVAKTEAFLNAYEQLKRESVSSIRLMADHTDEVDRILIDTAWLLKNVERPEAFARAVAGILARIEHHLAKRRPETLEQWPDGPGTSDGVCWVCAREGNVRWLADPMDKEPRDREPWCQTCYRVRRRSV